MDEDDYMIFCHCKELKISNLECSVKKKNQKILELVCKYNLNTVCPTQS